MATSGSSRLVYFLPSRLEHRAPRFHCFETLCAAAMISLATAAGCESIGTWLDGTLIVMAFILLANLRSRSGWIMRSFAATTYQVGFDFQAAVETLASNSALLVAPWVAKMSFCCAMGRSGAKFSNTPFFVSVR